MIDQLPKRGRRPTFAFGIRRLTLALLSILPLAVACNDDPVELGRARGLVHDAKTAAFSGELSGDVQVSISSGGTSWFELGSLNGITIALQSDSDTSNVHGEQDAPVNTYSRVRLVLDGVGAELKAGSIIGNTTLASDVLVGLGGADRRVEIDKQVAPFSVLGDDAVRSSILFLLNSRLWITEASLQQGVVEDAAIQGAVTAVTRVDGQP